MTKLFDTKITGIACARRGAKVGERCSDVDVFVHDGAFPLDDPMPLLGDCTLVDAARGVS